MFLFFSDTTILATVSEGLGISVKFSPRYRQILFRIVGPRFFWDPELNLATGSGISKQKPKFGTFSASGPNPDALKEKL
jgi:hypothetical protein